MDRSGQIHAQVLTDSSVDDASTAIGIIKATKGKVSSVTGDAAYDTVAIYDVAHERGAMVVVPPPSIGGGYATKIPSPSSFQYLLRWWERGDLCSTPIDAPTPLIRATSA